MTHIPEQKIPAHNDALSSENRIHSDATALRYGFRGALVSGVNVFGYMSQPLVQALGADWLSRGIIDVRFLKPAYDEELLTIASEPQDSAAGQRHYLTTASNPSGELLARLESWNPPQLPPLNPLANAPVQTSGTTRAEIAWDLIHIEETLSEYLWQPDIADNELQAQTQRDPSSLYGGADGFIHPRYLLDTCNKTLMRLFILPAWIHTGSRLVLRQALHVGQSIQVRAVPIRKWEHKGHQFITLYVAMLVAGAVAVEVEHTAIFRIAT